MAYDAKPLEFIPFSWWCFTGKLPESNTWHSPLIDAFFFWATYIDLSLTISIVIGIL
jgi:hypothetical protein